MYTRNELKDQIKITISSLRDRYDLTGDENINVILEKYLAVLSQLDSNDGDVKSRRLLNLARGYLELSSDYNQEFLKDMAKTEKIIKDII